MILLIDTTNKARFPSIMEAMLRHRAKTFGEDGLDWEVQIVDGKERDDFDDEDPLYLVSVDPTSGTYWGSLRLLPTTGPNMLRDVFSCLLAGQEMVSSPAIWESSRFCREDSQPNRMGALINIATAELLLGIGEVAELAGLTGIVSVFDPRIHRVLRAAGCKIELIGQRRRIGKCICLAGMFDVSRPAVDEARENVGIKGSVLAPGSQEIVLAYKSRHRANGEA